MVITASALADGEAQQIRLHHQLIPLSRQALDSAVAGYAAGKTDFTMVIDAERDLQMHEIELAMHLAAYEIHLAELERAVGADLGLAAAADAGRTPEEPR